MSVQVVLHRVVRPYVWWIFVTGKHNLKWEIAQKCRDEDKTLPLLLTPSVKRGKQVWSGHLWGLSSKSWWCNVLVNIIWGKLLVRLNKFSFECTSFIKCPISRPHVLNLQDLYLKVTVKWSFCKSMWIWRTKKRLKNQRCIIFFVQVCKWAWSLNSQRPVERLNFFSNKDPGGVYFFVFLNPKQDDHV